MTFREYQRASRRTAIYPDQGRNFVYPTLGLAGEAGEVADKIKKVLRDANGQLTDDQRQAIAAELGDVLWYLAQLATELGLDLDVIVADNLTKLVSRQQRGQLHGSGDRR